MLTLVDNYDSFVHTLARYCRELGVATRVVRNDAVTLAELAESMAVLLSPGPCGPAESGICRDAVRELSVPIFGVCLGHQAIVDACGGRVEAGPHPTHGRSGWITHDGSGLFAGIASPARVARYHSLHAATLPPELVTTAMLAGDGEQPLVMAVQHRSRPVYGVQFHPESVLTPCGRQLLANFLALAGFEGVADPQSLPTEAFCETAGESDDFYAKPHEVAYPLPGR